MRLPMPPARITAFTAASLKFVSARAKRLPTWRAAATAMPANDACSPHRLAIGRPGRAALLPTPGAPQPMAVRDYGGAIDARARPERGRILCAEPGQLR